MVAWGVTVCVIGRHTRASLRSRNDIVTVAQGSGIQSRVDHPWMAVGNELPSHGIQGSRSATAKGASREGQVNKAHGSPRQTNARNEQDISNERKPAHKTHNHETRPSRHAACTPPPPFNLPARPIPPHTTFLFPRTYTSQRPSMNRGSSYIRHISRPKPQARKELVGKPGGVR